MFMFIGAEDMLVPSVFSLGVLGSVDLSVAAHKIIGSVVYITGSVSYALPSVNYMFPF